MPCLSTTLRHLALLPLLAACASTAEEVIPLADATPGPVFEGLGALSAGASSRLLPDYPEALRRQILDLLFTPKVGAALQHLKVEIGGEVNSTCGTEPSHRRTRDETPDYTRGYEWWLMKEARARRPGIPLEALAWGAPAWIGNGTFYSQDMADSMADFITGARQVHGLDLTYVGLWNERMYDIPWIKTLRRTLDARGHQAVQIVGADQCTNQWKIAEDMAKDPELAAAVGVIGEHYPGYHTTDAAKTAGKRLWAAEDGPWRGDWQGARHLARVYNRNYVVGGMTKTIIWSLVTSYYDNLPLPGSGLMTAKTPWSGAFHIDPALWVTAHTTQVTEPGWRYLTGQACREIPGGSVVSLLAPDGKDLSVIAESMDAQQATTLVLTVPPALVGRTFTPWLTTETTWFKAGTPLVPINGRLTVTLPPQAVLSLTTTTGQRRDVPTSPPAAPFPTTYRDTFETTPVGRLGRFWSDQGGVFEVVADGGNRVLRQQVARKGIDWQPTPEPETFLGEPTWEDQSIAVRARLDRVVPEVRPEAARYLAVYTRVGYLGQNAEPAPGYGLRWYESGQWELRDARIVLATGVATPLGETWHTLTLAADGTRLTATLDGAVVAQVTDRARAFGQVGIGSGYHTALFDDLAVTGSTPKDLARRATATASSCWDDGLGPERAVDGIAADGLKGPTRWNSGKDVLPEEWLALDFGSPVTVARVRMVPFEDRQQVLAIQAWNGQTWSTIADTGLLDGKPTTIDLPPSTTSRLRLIGTGLKASLSFYDVQVFGPR